MNGHAVMYARMEGLARRLAIVRIDSIALQCSAVNTKLGGMECGDGRRGTPAAREGMTWTVAVYPRSACAHSADDPPTRRTAHTSVMNARLLMVRAVLLTNASPSD